MPIRLLTPGNMWAARCGYVLNLIDPMLFKDQMQKYYEGKRSRGQCNFNRNWCVGKGRWSAEHWIYSHPEVQPCDLDSKSTCTWGTPARRQSLHMAEFAGSAKHGNQTTLSTAPPPGFSYTVGNDCVDCGRDMAQRLEEYQFLYKQKPPYTWWGWIFFAGSIERVACPAQATSNTAETPSRQ